MTRTDWRILIAQNRLRNRRIWYRIKDLAFRGVLGLVLLGASVLLIGACDNPQKQVEEQYVVKKGDTLWTIGEDYLEKAGGNVYILEFIDGIKADNPELAESKGVVYPGQVLRINYQVDE